MTGEVKHHQFRQIVDELQEGDILVLNDTRVLPARLIGTKEDTGASIEVLLSEGDGNGRMGNACEACKTGEN